MSERLTHAEYQAIAAQLEPTGMSFIDGAFRPAMSGATFTTFNPATDEPICAVAQCNADDVAFAVEKARQAFDDGRWHKQPPAERKEVLITLAKLIKRHRHELAVLESLDSGKPIADCADVDIPETINTLLWHAEAIDKLYDQVAPTGHDAIAMVVREPIGVVAAVLPWNFPLLMLAWKIAPALAAGCSVIVKPAEQTSLTALRVAELAAEAGVPRGVLNVIPGTGPDVGAPLGLHAGIDMVTFTGSTETGRRFLRYAADSNLKKVVLELGGKNPCIVLDDAENLDRVAEHICAAAFWNMGENCSAGSRLIVQQGVKDALMQRVLKHLEEWRLGDPLDPQHALGALIDGQHLEKVSAYIEQGKSAGYALLAGGNLDGSPFVAPTIFDGVSPNDPLAQEEIFGPVLSVITVNSFDEAMKVANDTAYGLAASVFTASNRRALRAGQLLRAGTVTINCYGEGDISTPFGGFKQSGFGGRDNSIHAHDQYTELKTVWIDIGDDAIDGNTD